jgi:hypothetical protein
VVVAVDIAGDTMIVLTVLDLVVCFFGTRSGNPVATKLSKPIEMNTTFNAAGMVMTDDKLKMFFGYFGYSTSRSLDVDDTPCGRFATDDRLVAADGRKAVTSIASSGLLLATRSNLQFDRRETRFNGGGPNCSWSKMNPFVVV